MAQVRITNENLWTTDFGEADRKQFLRSLNREHSSRASCKSRYNRPASVWMTDVSATDKRSVKAQLRGQADYRPFWWSLCSRAIHLLAPSASLEERMFCFHSFHHNMTLCRLQTIANFQEIFTTIKRDGMFAGLLCAVDQAKREGQEKP